RPGRRLALRGRAARAGPPRLRRETRDRLTGVLGRLGRWVDDRLGATHFVRTALNKVFPDDWSFMLGEVALYCFVILVITGVYLTLFFNPSGRAVTYHGHYVPLSGLRMSEAYESTVHLSFDVRAGLVFRQVHHWA